MKYIILTIILIGCGTSHKDSKDIYLERFVEEADKRNIVIDTAAANLQINFTHALDNNTYAICHYATFIIEINIIRWVDLDNSGRELIMFHEMGHCLLRLKHREGGIMQAFIEEDEFDAYKTNRTEQLDELFTL